MLESQDHFNLRLLEITSLPDLNFWNICIPFCIHVPLCFFLVGGFNHFLFSITNIWANPFPLTSIFQRGRSTTNQLRLPSRFPISVPDCRPNFALSQVSSSSNSFGGCLEMSTTGSPVMKSFRPNLGFHKMNNHE